MSQAPSRSVKDRLDPARAEACAILLGREAPAQDVPPFWHHLYFWDTYPPEDLGRDGHPRPGLGVIPDMGLSRRMWAGGTLTWHHPLRLGLEATKETVLADAVRKTGRTGPLALVTLTHRILQDTRLCLEETQTLVYREDPRPGDRGTAPVRATAAPVEVTRTFDRITLMRYSSLTANGHRIHWDDD